MIRHLYFETSSTLFTRAQALIWVANGLSCLNIFEKSSGKIFAEIIENCSEEKSVLINFHGIIRCDDHSLDDVYDKLEGNKKQVIILNGETLLDDLIKLKKGKDINISHDIERKVITLGLSDLKDFNNQLKEREEAKEKYIAITLKNTFQKFKEFKRLCSTPFYANGEFDSKKIIESPKEFMWISFYLSDKLSQIIESEKLRNVTLVSASLRGAAFTSILGILNDLEYINLDHIGPVHRVSNSNKLINTEQKNTYVYIGDFVFGGTEIKLTKVYVGFNNSNLDHALVLGSLFEPEAFTDFKLFELSRLKKISTEADFKLFN